MLRDGSVDDETFRVLDGRWIRVNLAARREVFDLVDS